MPSAAAEDENGRRRVRGLLDNVRDVGLFEIGDVDINRNVGAPLYQPLGFAPRCPRVDCDLHVEVSEVGRKRYFCGLLRHEPRKVPLYLDFLAVIDDDIDAENIDYVDRIEQGVQRLRVRLGGLLWVVTTLWCCHWLAFLRVVRSSACPSRASVPVPTAGAAAKPGERSS
ncbi:MAG: hypothetical protein AAFR76_10305 [Planctomycetota bacterium]